MQNEDLKEFPFVSSLNTVAQVILVIILLTYFGKFN